MKKPCSGGEDKKTQTFLKNINAFLNFVQVMLLVDYHLQQLKI